VNGRQEKECGDYDCSKAEVDNEENPGGKIIENDAADHSRDKGHLGFNPLASQDAQSVFPHGQGATRPGQGFDGNQNDSGKMGNPQGKVADTAPSEGAAKENDDFPSNRKRHIGKVNDHDQVSEESERGHSFI
jgi:hypothetical protein